VRLLSAQTAIDFHVSVLSARGKGPGVGPGLGCKDAAAGSVLTTTDPARAPADPAPCLAHALAAVGIGAGILCLNADHAAFLRRILVGGQEHELPALGLPLPDPVEDFLASVLPAGVLEAVRQDRRDHPCRSLGYGYHDDRYFTLKVKQTFDPQANSLFRR